MKIQKNQWSPEEDSYLTSLCAAGRHRFEDMVPLFKDRTKNQIVKRVRHLNIINTYRKPPKYTYNQGYFDNVTLESAYWAGILQTDGCISERDNGYVTIIWGASAKDEEHMRSFLKCINSTHPILTYMKKCNLSTKSTEKEHPNCRISFEGAYQWANALKKHYGFDKNKTLRTNPPNLPSLLHKLAYLKGLIDGDGCITSSNQNGAMQISICGSNKEFVIWVKDLINSLNLAKPYLKKERQIRQEPGESCYYWTITGLRAAILHEALIRIPTPQLNRKWLSEKVLKQKGYWQNRPDLWPSEQHFSNILSPSS